MGDSATVPSIATVPPPTTKTQVFDRLKTGSYEVITKTLRETHSTLGSKFEYRVGDTVHFGTGLRLGIHTILDINSHIYKIGHSGT